MHGLNHEKWLHAAVGVNVEVPETPVRKPAVPQLEGEGGGGDGEGGGGDGGGGGGGEEKMRTSARLRTRFVPGSTMVT